MYKNIITVDLQQNENGTFDTWISTEGSSGAHYKTATAEEIGLHVKELIECLTEALKET
ncbi:MAG: hypothetical protein ACI4HI_18500 [Lachnospiraceae bacterium]